LSDNPHPFVRCSASSVRTGERCANAAVKGETFCNVHLRQQGLQSNPANALDPLPEIDMTSTPDAVIDRWLRSRDERTRFFAAKTALARELERPETQRFNIHGESRHLYQLSSLSHDEFVGYLTGLKRAAVELRDNPPTETTKAHTARDVMANLKTSRDARISVNAALELEHYERQRPRAKTYTREALDAFLETIDRVIASRGAWTNVEEEQRLVLENARRLREQTPEPEPDPAPTTKPRDKRPAPQVPTIVKHEDGSWEERFTNTDGSVRVRLHMPERKPINPFSLLSSD